ncbi:MAG: aldehyde dehydrogenase family protein, partial [Flavobacteriaceae bacterium]
MSTVATSFGIEEALQKLGIQDVNYGTSTGTQWLPGNETIASHSPVDGSLIGKVTVTAPDDYEKVMETATKAFKTWRLMPAPQRGEIVRQFGEELRKLKQPLGKLVSYEMGKSYQEGLGEVQEMIDICDFAV